MSRKRRKIKKIKSYLGYAIIACGVLAILSLLLTGVVLVAPEGMDNIKINGFTAIFGWVTENELILGFKKLTVMTNFSFMGLLIIIFPLAGTIISLLKNKTLELLSILFFLAGAVFAYLLKTDFLNSATELLKNIMQFYTAKLGIGAILSGTFSTVGVMLCAIKLYLK